MPPPDQGVIIQRTGQQKRVYHILKTFRNEKGRTTHEKVLIGRLNDEGLMVPNASYFEYYPSQNLDKQSNLSSKSINFDLLSSITSIGYFFVVKRILRDLSLDQILEDVFGPYRAELIITLAAYMFCQGHELGYIEGWSKDIEYLETLTDQMAPELLSSITPEEKMDFFEAWLAKARTGDCLAYDLTTATSYPEKNPDDWEFNYDPGRLPPIHLGYYLAQDTGLPLFYVTYPLSITKESYLSYMTASNDELNINIKDIVFFLHRNFYSKSNLQYLHKNDIKYIIDACELYKTTRLAIDKVHETIESRRNHVFADMFAEALRSRFHGLKSNIYLYYSPDLAEKNQYYLFTKLRYYEETLTYLRKTTKKQIKKHSCYYDINVNKNRKFTYSINYEKVDLEDQSCGFVCLISNIKKEKYDMFQFYMNKIFIRETLYDLSNCSGLLKTEYSYKNILKGKLFCAFISLIIASRFTEQIISVNDSLEQRLEAKESALFLLNKIEAVKLKTGQRLLSPLTNKQRELLAKFGISEKDLTQIIQNT